jgi:hypothetical protein
VGLEWTVAGFGNLSGTPNETDLLLRNTTMDAFPVYDIGNNHVLSTTPMSAVRKPAREATSSHRR